MKIYDKEMFRRSEILKSTTLLLIVFLLGFAIGYVSNTNNARIKELESEIKEKANIIETFVTNQI
jgi:hypothetical protein